MISNKPAQSPIIQEEKKTLVLVKDFSCFSNFSVSFSKFLKKDIFGVIFKREFNFPVFIEKKEMIRSVPNINTRICASNKSGDWGRLGVKIAALFEATILFDVPPESFDIKPKVQSSFIRLIPRVNPLIALSKFMEFSNLVDQSFANKRKGIKNNLKRFEINYEKLHINPLARAEELSIEDFIAVFQTTDI